MAQRIAGLIEVQVNGTIQRAKGAFEYDLGAPKREGIKGSDGRLHGFKETQKVAYIEGKITDAGDVDVKALALITGATVTLTLGNSKTVVLSNAYYAGDGKASTEEAEVDFRFEGDDGQEIL